jgi:hypothetical protein
MNTRTRQGAEGVSNAVAGKNEWDRRGDILVEGTTEIQRLIKSRAVSGVHVH